MGDRSTSRQTRNLLPQPEHTIKARGSSDICLSTGFFGRTPRKQITSFNRVSALNLSHSHYIELLIIYKSCCDLHINLGVRNKSRHKQLTQLAASSIAPVLMNALPNMPLTHVYGLVQTTEHFHCSTCTLMRLLSLHAHMGKIPSIARQSEF